MAEYGETGGMFTEVDPAEINIGSLSGIYLPAGQKITRAFRIDENKPLENQLQVLATPLGPGGVSVKLTAEQYRSGI